MADDEDLFLDHPASSSRLLDFPPPSLDSTFDSDRLWLSVSEVQKEIEGARNEVNVESQLPLEDIAVSRLLDFPPPSLDSSFDSNRLWLSVSEVQKEVEEARNEVNVETWQEDIVTETVDTAISKCDTPPVDVEDLVS